MDSVGFLGWRWLEVDIQIPVPTHNTASVFMGSRGTEPACLGTPFPGVAQAVFCLLPWDEAVRSGEVRAAAHWSHDLLDKKASGVPWPQHQAEE